MIKKTNTIGQWEKFLKIRNKCNKLYILNAKQSYFDKISEKINTETNGSKKWWNLVKSLLHSDSGGDRSIPLLFCEFDFYGVCTFFYFCSDPRWIIFLYRYESIWNILFAASKIVFVIVLVMISMSSFLKIPSQSQQKGDFCKIHSPLCRKGIFSS
jgi:hypothetical protein